MTVPWWTVPRAPSKLGGRIYPQGCCVSPRWSSDGPIHGVADIDSDVPFRADDLRGRAVLLGTIFDKG